MYRSIGVGIHSALSLFVCKALCSPLATTIDARLVREAVSGACLDPVPFDDSISPGSYRVHPITYDACERYRSCAPELSRLCVQRDHHLPLAYAPTRCRALRCDSALTHSRIETPPTPSSSPVRAPRASSPLRSSPPSALSACPLLAAGLSSVAQLDIQSLLILLHHRHCLLGELLSELLHLGLLDTVEDDHAVDLVQRSRQLVGVDHAGDDRGDCR